MSHKGLSERQQNAIVWTATAILVPIVFYIVFMNIYTRFNHPGFTETQIIIKTFNWKYQP